MELKVGLVVTGDLGPVDPETYGAKASSKKRVTSTLPRILCCIAHALFLSRNADERGKRTDFHKGFRRIER